MVYCERNLANKLAMITRIKGGEEVSEIMIEVSWYISARVI